MFCMCFGVCFSSILGEATVLTHVGTFIRLTTLFNKLRATTLLLENNKKNGRNGNQISSIVTFRNADLSPNNQLTLFGDFTSLYDLIPAPKVSDRRDQVTEITSAPVDWIGSLM